MITNDWAVDDGMDLSEILKSFNAPIKEEQAWAVCHLCGKYLQSKGAKEKPLPNGINSINFDKNGLVTISGKFVDDEAKIISNLGLVLFSALDYGLSADEEQLLSEDLELLISSMTGQLPSSDEDVDEGYADTKFNDVSIDNVVALCEKHLPSSIDAGSHYLAVCRALVHEALELKAFLTKIVSANECLQKLSGTDVTDGQKKENEDASLNFTEWAHVWMQVLDQLRKGVTRLRKVEKRNQISVEYELTPYEILMEDIRQKKYSLKKVTSNERMPHALNRNAHDVILDFIRSRPSLSPAHDRVLAPVPPRSKSLHERLLEQIHEQNVSLKHIDQSQVYPLKRSSSDVSVVTSSQRRRLKPILIEEIEFPNDSEQSSSDVEDLELYVSDGDGVDELSSLQLSNFTHDDSSLRSSGTSGVSSSSAGDVASRRPIQLRMPNEGGRKRVLPLELLPSPNSPEEILPRRSSFLSSMFSSFRKPNGVSKSQSAFFGSPIKEVKSNVELSAPQDTPIEKEGDNLTSTPVLHPAFRRTYSERFVSKDKIKSQESTLRLSFDEIVHIRQVLARAQLEKHQSSNELYQALKSEKVCFCCHLKKFNFFAWASTCQICKRKVCGKCLKKVRFPTCDSSDLLLFSLSPALTPLALQKKEFFKKSSIPIQFKTVTSNLVETTAFKKMDVCLDCHVVLSVDTVE